MSNYSDSAFSDENQNSSWYKVLQLVPDKAEVLDVGCSSGNFGVELIRHKGCVVDGIEIDKGDAAKAAKKLRKVVVLDIERDNIEDIKALYDVIYFGDVIEHLVNPTKALAKIKKLLKPQGKIVFSIPNMAHATVRLQLLKGEFEYTETGLIDKTHLHFYNLKEVQNVFKEAGFKIRKLDFVEKDYPNELIKDYLKGLGLTPTKQFYELMHQADAAAFQFVGEAVVLKEGEKPMKRKQFGPIDFFETFYENSVGAMRQHIKNLESEVQRLEGEKAALNERLKYYTEHPVRSAVHTIRKHK